MTFLVKLAPGDFDRLRGHLEDIRIGDREAFPVWMADVLRACQLAAKGPLTPCALCKAGVPVNGAIDGRPTHVILVAGDPRTPQHFYIACEVTS